LHEYLLERPVDYPTLAPPSCRYYFLAKPDGGCLRIRDAARARRTPAAFEAERNMQVFVTGGTGYIGGELLPALLARGHGVAALTRPGSAQRLPTGCRTVIGDVLDSSSYRDHLGDADTLVHLVGIAHPSPAKAGAFRSIDLASAHEALAAAQAGRVKHFVYLSVAQPAPVMRAYVAARAEAEATIFASGLAATFLRPWYVLGPGHRWPLVLLPAYWLLGALPATRDTSHRLGLVRIDQMVRAIVRAVEQPPQGVRVVEVPEIRRAGQ
jgi:uncharacterized protein YbjT (DUF2867 family)